MAGGALPAYLRPSMRTRILAAAALLVSLTSGHETNVSKALSHPWLVRLGVLSYSIYLWHYGIAFALRNTLDPISTGLITFAASFVLASLSQECVEAPLRKWVSRTRAQNRVREYAYQAG